jgi:hypothetical protein
VALAFRDDAALEAVLRTRLVPVETVAAAARVARRDHALILAPERALAKAVGARLAAIGVDVAVELPGDARAVSCWAEAIAPIRAKVEALPALVLFVVPRVADLIDLAAELVRLGCDRQELLVAGDLGAIRAVDPPTYTLVRALDRDRGLRAFAPVSATPGAAWCELGFCHPLGDDVHAPPDRLLAIGPEPWVVLPDRGWRPLSEALDLVPASATVEIVPGLLPARRRVELRLTSGRREPASLWVIREHAVATIDRLLAYLPEDVIDHLIFAASANDPPIVVLRARPGRHAAPELAFGVGAEAYAALADLPDVHAPVGTLVEPPLRHERLRSVLGVERGEVAWLARAANDGIRIERIADDAFQPLAEWVDYVIHAGAPALVPWSAASLFEFAPYVSTGLEWSEAPAPNLGREPHAGRSTKRAGAAPPAPKPVADEIAPAKPPTRAARSRAARMPEVATEPLEVDPDLAELEAAFVVSDAPGDAPERLALFDRLGRAYARLGRARDASLCFVRAIWESPADAPARLDAWVASELRGAGASDELQRTLSVAVPDPDDVRRVALLAARAGTEIAAAPHAVQRWLDEHDGALDARLTWLARLGLSRLVGGDALGLARARDRVLARLAGGIAVDRELPALLRFASRSGAFGTSGAQLADALDELARRATQKSRKRSPIEAPTELTFAYVGMQLAYGFARIGKADRARGLVAGSREALAPANDVVHAYLVAVFAARVDQAIAGVPPETPLPDELAAQLAALDRVARYKVDRLREASRILEPHERPDAIGAFSKRQKDARGPEFSALQEMNDPTRRARAVGELVAAARAVTADRERLLAGVFDVLLELPEALAVSIFQTAVPVIETVAPERRAVLYAGALVVAGHFGRTELVPKLLVALGEAIRVASGPDIERVLQWSLRVLRRIGLRDQLARLLVQVEATRSPEGPDALRGRLALAAGLAYLGDTGRALAIIEQGRSTLDSAMQLTARLELVRALAFAYANAPLGDALGGIRSLADQVVEVTDSYGTNSHYCLSLLHYFESLVLGVTSDDLVLGEAGRRFIDDDEHLIRRRLHRDLQGAT